MLELLPHPRPGPAALLPGAQDHTEGTPGKDRPHCPLKIGQAISFHLTIAKKWPMRICISLDSDAAACNVILTFLFVICRTRVLAENSGHSMCTVDSSLSQLASAKDYFSYQPRAVILRKNLADRQDKKQSVQD